MTEAAVFRGTIGALRTIGGRKVIAVTVEVPIEEQSTVAKIAEHGAWVAVARLADGEAPKPVEKERRSWGQLSVAEQAGIRCNEGAFWKYLNKHYHLYGTVSDANGAAGHVREIFGVISRKDIPEIEWREFDSDYQNWLRA